MKFNSGWSIGLVSALTLAACAQFGKQAPLEEPTAYSLSPGESVGFVRDAWWLQLRDKKLDTLIAQALQTSPDLRAVKARFEQVQAQLGITEAADKAQLGLSVRGIGVYTSPKPDASRSDTDHTLLLANTALQGSWSFDFWGKNREKLAAVVGQRQAVLYEAAQVRVGLAQAVAAQYFAWQALVEQNALLSRRIDLAEKKKQLVQRRVNAKLMPSEAVYPLDLAAQQLQLEKTALEQNVLKVRHGLAVLAGKSPTALAVAEPDKMIDPPALPVNRIHADLLAARPDIAAQKALLASGRHMVKSTEAEFYPDIELKVLAGLAHIDAFNVVRGRTSGMVGILPALNLPIFTSGALQSRLAGKRAEYNEQVAVYDRTVLNAMRSAADAVADYQSLQKQQPVWDKMLKTAEQSAQASQSRVKAGLDNGLATLEKQDELVQLKMKKAQQRAGLLTAWSNVYAQLGGGFKSADTYIKR